MNEVAKKDETKTEILGSLTPAEEQRRETLEKQIVSGWNTASVGFQQMGEALKEIADSMLYRSTHASFNEYVQDRWDIKYHQARNLIRSADVLKNLSLAGNVQPTAERQVRPLASLPSPEDQREAWNEAVDDAGGNQPTHEQVEKAAKRTQAKKVGKQAEAAEAEKAAAPAPAPAPEPESGQSVAEIAAERKAEKTKRLTDDEYLAECPAYGKLPERVQKKFRIEALAYRAMEKHLDRFREAVRPILTDAKKQYRGKGAYLGLASFFLGLEDPRGWDRCSKCKGEGTVVVGDEGETQAGLKCETCEGRGYRVK